MATRFYLPSSGAAAISPAPDSGWEDTSSFSRRATDTSKQGSAMSTASFSDADVSNRDVLLLQYVSQPLAAQTIQSQTIRCVARASEDNGGNNLFLALGVRVLSNDGSSETATILAVSRDNTELSSPGLQNRNFSATTTSVTAQAGDRLVFELGAGGDPIGGASHTCALRTGDSSGTDLPQDDSTTTDNNPWIEFATDTITFQPPASGSSADRALGRGLERGMARGMR